MAGVSGSPAHRKLAPTGGGAGERPAFPGPRGHAPQGSGTSMVTGFMGPSFGQMTFQVCFICKLDKRYKHYFVFPFTLNTSSPVVRVTGHTGSGGRGEHIASRSRFPLSVPLLSASGEALGPPWWGAPPASPPSPPCGGGARCLLTPTVVGWQLGLSSGWPPLAVGGSSTVPSVLVGPALGALGFCVAAATAEGLHFLCGPWHKIRRLSS